MAGLWTGIDAGKEAHHAAAVDKDGRTVWSTRVANDQAAINELIGRTRDDDVVWAVDLLSAKRRCCGPCSPSPATTSSTYQAAP